MEKLIINNYDEFASYLGKNLGASEWVELPQERINQFADATLDHQWIHVDTERAAVESPFKSTIAHGYLTLSMLPYMWNQIIEVNNLKMMVNYGMDKMKFGQAVLSGQSIRLVADLHSIENLRRRLSSLSRLRTHASPPSQASPPSSTTSTKSSSERLQLVQSV